MRMATIGALAVVVGMAGACQAQMGGGAVFAQGGGKGRAQQAERAKRVLTREAMPPSATTSFVEASVLMNVKADAYVAMFGISTEAATVEACQQELAVLVGKLTEAVRALEVAEDAIYIDFVAQNKTYAFEVEGNIAKEKMVGLELKKTLAVRFEDRTLLDKLLAAAAAHGVYDLIKVDYVVEDIGSIHDRLMEEAARVVDRKRGRHERLLGVEPRGPAQIFAEQYSVYYPTEMYDSYVAAETEEIETNAMREKYTVQRARKGRTFYYNGLDADGFDAVINPVVLEPVVQFTLYLKVKREVVEADKE